MARDRTWTWVHTLLAVLVWVVSVCCGGFAAVWLDESTDWNSGFVVSVFIAILLSAGCVGTVVLHAHADPEPDGPATEVTSAVRWKGVIRSLPMAGLLVAISVAGTAAVGGLFVLGTVLVRWLEGGPGLPGQLAGLIGVLVVIGTPVAVMVAVGVLTDRRTSTAAMDAATVRADDGWKEGLAAGQRRHDPVLVADVEAITGRPVRWVVRFGETPAIQLEWGAVEGQWYLGFCLGEIGHVVIAAYLLDKEGDQALVERGRTAQHRRSWRPFDPLRAGVRAGFVITSHKTHWKVEAYLGDLWTAEVLVPAELTEETAVALARRAVERTERMLAVGDLPWRAGRTSLMDERFPVPLRESDIESVAGHRVTAPSSGTAWQDHHWYREFDLGQQRFVACRAVWLGGDDELRESDRQAWANLAEEVEPVPELGPDAFRVDGTSPYEHDFPGHTVWTGVDRDWTVQVSATAGITTSHLAALAGIAAGILRSSGTGSG